MATTPSTHTPPADRGAPTAFVAGPKTLQERLRFLEQDARRILRSMESHRAEEIAWAKAMMDAAPQDRSIGGSRGED